jgi:hypothetical protein
MPGDPLTFDQATSDLDVPRDTQGADHLGVLGKLSPRESSPAPGVGGISSTRDMAPSGAPNQSSFVGSSEDPPYAGVAEAPVHAQRRPTPVRHAKAAQRYARQETAGTIHEQAASLLSQRRTGGRLIHHQ